MSDEPDPWNDFARELGARMLRARAEKRMSQEQVAHAAGLATFTYRKLEKGESNPGTAANPRLRTLVALADVLGVPLRELIPTPPQGLPPRTDRDVGGWRFTSFVPTDVRVVVAYDGPARKVSGMNEGLSTDGVDRVRCIHPWCVTEHGATVHPDDEDHRSAGVALTVRARRAEARGPGEETELELGVLRRAGESETWIVIETGIGASLALTRDGARLLLRRLGDLIAPGGILGRDGDER